MKKVIVLIAPLVIALIIFVSVTYFLNTSLGKGALQVTSSPQSKVYLDGKLVGKTPLCIGSEQCEMQDMIKSGDYAIKLVPPNSKGKPYEAKISINKLTLTVVDRTFGDGASSHGSIITLTSISNKKDAELFVVSFPDKANIILNNNFVGVTPLLLKNLTESDHDLKVAKEGYLDKFIKIRTTLGYKLESLVFLGVDPNVGSPSAEIEDEVKHATTSAVASSAKIVILNTPTGFLRVREDSSTSSSEIGRVLPGETYEFIEEKDGWYKIQFKEDVVGWVSGQYAKK